MVMMSIDSFLKKVEHETNLWFQAMILFHIVLIVFFIALHKLSNAVSFYHMIKKGTYLKKGWNYAKANVTAELDLTYYSTEKDRFAQSIYGFEPGDTVEILYRERDPRKYIRFDAVYWHDRIFVSSIFTVISFIVCFAIMCKYGIGGIMFFWCAVPYMISGG
ncbi:MAG TPA: hypothetical protein RWO09_00885 [Ruminococcus sp.]